MNNNHPNRSRKAAKHTPTPWKVYQPLRGKYRGDYAIGTIYEGDPLFAYLAKGRPDIQEANAAFIVTACNSYEENIRKIEALVERLEDVLPSLREYHSHSTPPVKGRLGREIREAEEALKLARGE